MTGEPPRRKTSLVGIAENDGHGHQIPNMARRMSRSMMSDTGSSINSFKRSLAMKPRHEMENSYRTVPIVKFPSSAVSKKIQIILDSRLTNMKYDHDICKALSNTMSDVIKDEVRRDIKDIERYKLVCWVTIGQVSGQDIRVVSRCLWSHQHDTCSSASFRNNEIFAVATLYALYYDGCYVHRTD